MTVVENIVARRGAATARPARPRTGARARASSARYGLAVEPGRGHRGDRRRPAAARSRSSRRSTAARASLILDEPTAVLTPQEADQLFVVLRTLVAQGTSIIPDHAQAARGASRVTDRITGVCGAARRVTTIEREGATERSLAELMVGREVLLDVARGAAHPARRCSSVREPRCAADRGLDAVRGLLDGTSCAGEIVGPASRASTATGRGELIRPSPACARTAGPYRSARASDVTRTRPRAGADAGVGHIGGSPAPRARASELLAGRERHHPARLADWEPISRHHWLNSRRHDGACGRAGSSSTTCAAAGLRHPRGPLGRQPAEGRARARDPVESPRSDRRAADAGPRRGRDRVPAPPARRAARCGLRRSARPSSSTRSLDLADRILVMYGGQIVLERASGQTDERELGVAMTGGKVPA